VSQLDDGRRAPLVLLAIDHLFVDDERVADGVYQALGALDAACPLAIATLSPDDLRLLVAAAAGSAARQPASARRALLDGACRRIEHVLDRARG
jgi:hypothetical protein